MNLELVSSLIGMQRTVEHARLPHQGGGAPVRAFWLGGSWTFHGRHHVMVTWGHLHVNSRGESPRLAAVGVAAEAGS